MKAKPSWNRVSVAGICSVLFGLGSLGCIPLSGIVAASLGLSIGYVVAIGGFLLAAVGIVCATHEGGLRTWLGITGCLLSILGASPVLKLVASLGGYLSS